jgi:CheY-like chemotaxis protein
LKRCRVLLVDDMPEVIEYCTGILEPDFEIVGTATTGAAASMACSELDPDVIVLDISMPGWNGMEVARRLRSSGCDAVIVFFSADEGLAEAALAAGGSAFVTKSRAESDLRVAIGKALAGREFFSLSKDGGPR